MYSSARTPRRSLASVLAATLAASALGVLTTAGPAQADTSPVAPTPATVSGDLLPTAQIGTGIVWDQVIVGNTVYVAGQFSTARPAGAAPGVNEVSRSNLLAYNLTTGELLPWAPTANGAVKAIAASADGTRIFIGGSFTSVSGLSRYRLAAVDAATGAPVAGFQANVEARVNDLVVSGDTVYLGGIFSVVRNVARTRLAAVSATNGALLSWAPTADAEVLTLTAPAGSGKVVVGGRFANINSTPTYGMGALDAQTAALVPWQANATIRNGGNNAAIYSLKSDAERVYGTGYTFGTGGNFEGTFAATVADGSIEFVTGCRGDSYDIEPVGTVLYHVGHMHDCSTIGGLPELPVRGYQRAAASTTTRSASGLVNAGGNFSTQPAPEWLHWTPDLAAGTFTGSDQAAWTTEGTADYLTVAGEFPSVNGIPQQGIARFARTGLAANAEGPKAGQDLVPAVDTSVPGSVRLSWTASWDRDSQWLTYEVLRGATLGASTIVGTLKRGNAWYDREGMRFTDTTAPAGSTQTYRIRVTDGLGNVLIGNAVTATVPAGSPTSPAYTSLVRTDGATRHWRLGESGTTAVDWAGTDNLTLATGATGGQVGPITGDTDPATTFPGTASVPAASSGASVPSPLRVSVEAWIKTTTTRGGKIVGFGSSRTGSSSTNDRHLYMTNSGQLVMGVSLGGLNTVISPAAYNDGTWHHVVGSVGAAGLQLFVDGSLVASSATPRNAVYYKGYWRVAGDNLTNWPNRPTSNAFAGTIDEVAVYPHQLSAEAVTAHWEARTGQVANQPPIAAFSTGGSGRTLTFNATGSNDLDGTITSYAWDFGDGTTGTDVTTSHQYPDVAASYPVTLTVTDNLGATASVTHTVTVTPPPNQSPTAAFTATATGLAVVVNGTTSVDPDGSIAAYAWDFGDGATATGASAPHTYAAAGTYTVALTVTDNRGATASTSQEVTVQPIQAGQTVAADAFDRDLASGWGSAATGGSWSFTGTGSTTAVSGGAGLMTVPAGKTLTARLNQVSSAATDLTFTTWTDGPVTGGGVYISGILRGGSGGDYRMRVRLQSTGVVTAGISKLVGTTETFLAGQVTVPGLTYTTGSKLRVRAQVSGADPTQISYRVWLDGATEPTTWLQTVTDSTAGLQGAGWVGLVTYVSGTATSPAAVRFDDLSGSSL